MEDDSLLRERVNGFLTQIAQAVGISITSTAPTSSGSNRLFSAVAPPPAPAPVQNRVTNAQSSTGQSTLTSFGITTQTHTGGIIAGLNQPSARAGFTNRNVLAEVRARFAPYSPRSNTRSAGRSAKGRTGYVRQVRA